VTDTRRTKRRTTTVTASAAAIACMACCAGPVLAVLGGLTIASIAAAVWIPPLSALAIAAATATIWVLRRRRTVARHSPDAVLPATVDLGMPTPPPTVRPGQTGQTDQTDQTGRVDPVVRSR
jgi:Flp pilus assembly protein TadB